MAKMTSIQVLKTFFGSDGSRPVTNAELVELRKGDPKGYEWLVEEAARELGVELEKQTT
ncbi:MAG: hypothetical protein ACOYT7_00595 [Patescibacteria group bacterium]